MSGKPTQFHNPGGPTLGTVSVPILEVDGLYFKNLSRSGKLLPYEDWRLDPKTRAADLASRLSAAEIAGLMLWSPHQMVPFLPGMPFKGHYGGRNFDPGQMDPAALTDQQKSLILDQKIRNILLTFAQSPEISCRWNNHLQALAEQSPWGIPVCISSDPRHAAGQKGAEFSGQGKENSRWPEGMGLAATFDPELVEEFAKVVAREYRAMGICLALGPQIDMATDPRWMRLEDTYGTKAHMTAAMARAYCDGLQTTEGSPDGWGKNSVAAMVKHWPGGGTGEAGRDAHYVYGKYAVYPGNRIREHMKPFTEGAFKLSGPTGKAAAVMPYYTISWNQDTKYGENVGNSYSRYFIDDLLRRGENYDGVVCTDWGITPDPGRVGGFESRAHGVELLPEHERYLKILLNGVDMYGGCSNLEPVLKAYDTGCSRYGETFMRQRLEQSAVRILTIMFRLGLFEDPYTDPEDARKIVGAPEFVQAGLEAQRRSVVLLKNQDNVLPLKKGRKLYVPGRHIGPHMSFFRTPIGESDIVPLEQHQAEGYFTLVSDPKEADAAVVIMESPLCECYSEADAAAGGNGYLPISLQYRPYTAHSAREHSIARGDYRELDCDRSYKGKTNTARNEQDLDNLLSAREQMGEKPVIAVLQLHNPAVVSEFEEKADGILAHFGVENRVLMEILCGEANPGGKLPVILPSDMDTVERHCEDIDDDIEPYRDSAGNCYNYGFGLRYS